MQSDGEPSIVALKTATLLASSFVEMVLRESPVGEYATNGVAESALREVKRQTRTLKVALEAHVGKIVEPHSILKWIPTMADAISFFRIGEMARRLKCDVLDVLGRSSLQNWGIRLLPPSGSKMQVECNESCMLDGILDTTRELTAFSS